MAKNRVTLTPEEALLWTQLKAFRASGYAFRRQVKLGVFRADFACRKARVVVELDGEHHATDDAQWDHDRARDAWMRGQGYVVLRFGNYDVRRNMDGVLETIEHVTRERLGLPPLL